MRMKLSAMTPLLGAAAAGVAIIIAPIASAADSAGPAAEQSCGQSGSGTICQSPGNAQINDSPPPASFYPYGGEAFLLGGSGFGGGGFHGGGGGHR